MDETVESTAEVINETVEGSTSFDPIPNEQPSDELKFPEKYLTDGEPDYDKLVKGYNNLETKLGERSLAPQTPDEYSFDVSNYDPEASEGFKQLALENGLSVDQYNAIMEYYAQYGVNPSGTVPGNAEDYEFNFEERGIDVDPNLSSEFKGLAKQLGLSQTQYEKLVDAHFNAVSVTNTPDYAANALKQEWGKDFSTNIEYAKQAFKTYGQGVNEASVGNNPEVLKLLANLGKDLGEDNGVRNQPTTNASNYSDEQINQLMLGEAYNDPMHPAHKETMNRVTRWFEQKYH